MALWGKSGSPLVVDDMVMISVGGPADSTADGRKQYTTPRSSPSTSKPAKSAGPPAHGKAAYASPVLADLAGERQIIIVNESWVTAHRRATAKCFGSIRGGTRPTNRIRLAAGAASGDRLFLSKGYGVGASLLSIRRGADDRFALQPLWNPPIKRVMKTQIQQRRHARRLCLRPG